MYYSSMSCKSKTGENYSVDMVRLRFEFNKDSKGNCLIEYIKRYDGVMFNVDSKRKYALYKYQYHYTVKTLSGSVLVIEHYFFDETAEGMRKGFIEFNPNKFISEDDYYVLNGFLDVLSDDILYGANYFTDVFKLVRWDLAIDFLEPRDNMYLVKDKRNYQYISGRGGVTQYLGVRNAGGFVKLYDKTKESKLDETLTRLELTFDGYDYPTLPVVYIKRRQQLLSLGLNDTQMVLVDLLKEKEPQEREMYFKRLGRKYQQTLKPYIFDDHQYEYDFQAIYNLFDKLKQLEKGIIEPSPDMGATEFHNSENLAFD